MRRDPWLVAAFLLLHLAGHAAWAGSEPSPILVSYSFDDGKTDTGPDTFSVFRNAKGRDSVYHHLCALDLF